MLRSPLHGPCQPLRSERIVLSHWNAPPAEVCGLELELPSGLRGKVRKLIHLVYTFVLVDSFYGAISQHPSLCRRRREAPKRKESNAARGLGGRASMRIIRMQRDETLRKKQGGAKNCPALSGESIFRASLQRRSCAKNLPGLFLGHQMSAA